MKTRILLFAFLSVLYVSAQTPATPFAPVNPNISAIDPGTFHPVSAPRICGGAADHLKAKAPEPSVLARPQAPAAAPVNPYIIVQSIHNVVAKWYGGSVYRFDIGTGTTGANCYNINAGHLLWSYQTNTGGHSFPELQASALANGKTFNVGDPFYINLYYTAASSASGKPDLSLPATFNWVNLGNAANNVTITVATTYAVGTATALPFTAAQAAKLQTFYDLVNPIVKEVYGPPSMNHTVTVVNDAFAVGKNVFYNGPDEISSNNVNMINSYGDLDQPRLLVHELVHAYHDNVCLSTNSEWHYDPALSGFEEGLAEGVALIVMDIFNTRYPNFFSTPDYHRHWNEEGGMPFEWGYDFDNHRQITTEDFWSSDIATGSGTLRYGLGATAIRKMYIEDPNVFKNFNAEYYKRLNADHTLIPNRTLVVDAFQTVKAQMERTPMTKWINEQHIFDCKIDQRKKIFLLSYTNSWWGGFEHDNRIFFVETHKYGSEWYWQSADQAGANEIPLNSATNTAWSWTHQLNNVPGTLAFIRDWNNTTLKSRNIITAAHWVLENPNDPVKYNKTLAGPYQGANPWYINSVLTRDHEQDNCTLVPGCGKRAWAIGNQPMYTTTDATKPNTLPSRVELSMHESGLFRFEISFNDPKGPVNTDSYFRLLGDDFIDMKQLFGGIYSTTANQVDGKLFIEHEKYTAEPAITIKNNSFKSSRLWTAIPATQTEFKMGRNDVAYTTPGKVHAIYVSQDCSKKKIDFRTVGYGCLIDGSQMLLFNVDEMEDIKFITSKDTTLCKGGSFSLKVTNNFTDILNKEKGTRIKYTWKDPNNNIVSTDTVFTKSNALSTDGGTYTLSIEFFGCTAAFNATIKVTIDTSASIKLAHPSDITVCTGQPINLNANVISGTVTSYNWTGPNGYIQTNVQNPVITGATANHAGPYIVTVTGTGCGGVPITAKDTIVVKIDNTVTLQLAHPADITICAGEAIELKADVIAGTANGYNWIGPNGYTQTNVQNPVINVATVNNSGLYIVTASGTGCGGAIVTAKDTILVTVNTTTALQLAHPADITTCTGDAIYLKADVLSGTVTSYNWTGPNGYMTNVQNPVISAATANHSGLYIVTASGTGCGGAVVTAKDTIRVTVNTSIALQLTHPPDITLCAGETINLKADVTTGTVTSYNWTGPNGFLQTNVQNPVIGNATVNHNGQYIVTATGTGCGGAVVTAKDTILVTIKNNPVVNPVATPLAPACPGDTVTLNVNAIVGATYVWTGPAGFTSTNINPVIPTVNASKQGIYTVTVSVPGCIAGTLVTGKSTTELIIKNASVVPISDQKICEGETLYLNAVTSTTANSYEWVAPDKTIISTSATATVTSLNASKTGIYQLNVDFGCSGLNSSKQFNVTLEDKEICNPSTSYYMPTAFSPNGDGENDVLYVYGNSIAEMALSIYDRWGTEVFSTGSTSFGWDGTYKGELLNTAVFAYKLAIKFTDGSAVKVGGNVTLIR